MFVTVKEEKKTLKYQEKMNVDIENIFSKKEQFWRSIYEVIDDLFIEDNRDVPSLLNIIGESLAIEKENFNNIIHFSNAIMSSRREK